MQSNGRLPFSSRSRTLTVNLRTIDAEVNAAGKRKMLSNTDKQVEHFQSNLRLNNRITSFVKLVKYKLGTELLLFSTFSSLILNLNHFMTSKVQDFVDN